MLKITAKKKEGGKWPIIDLPEKLTDQIEALKQMAGEPVVIEISCSNSRTFLCGTPELTQLMRDKFPDAVVMGVDAAHNELEFNPEGFLTFIKLFSTQTEATEYFPEKKRWW